MRLAGLSCWCLQGSVYLLHDSSQKPLGWVLKAKTAGKGGLLAPLFPSWEREWTVGRQLTTEVGARRLELHLLSS